MLVSLEWTSIRMTKRFITTAVFGTLMVGHALMGGNVQAEPVKQNNWRFFADLHADLRSDLDPKSTQDASDTSADAGVLYHRDLTRAKLLGEAFVSDDEGEIKRLQLGWVFSDEQTLWLGRFYNPVGYWNVHYHHGGYIAPAMHRPSLVEYEDKGGILPMHTTGALLEGTMALAEHTLGYQFAVGEGPELNDKGKLEAADIVNMGATEHDRSLTARVSLMQGGASAMETGVFVNRTIIPAKLAGISEIEQKLFGAFFYANWSPLEAIWSLYTVTNTVKQAGSEQQGSFSGGYVRLGYSINKLWTAYIRMEDVQRAGDDPYLSLFPNFVIDRNLAGLRLNFRKNQSLSFELLQSKLNEGSHMHTSVQWSAMFN